MRRAWCLSMMAGLMALLLLGGPPSQAKVKAKGKAAPAAAPGQPAKNGGVKPPKPTAAETQDRQVEKLRPQLGATDDEWVVIKPLLAAVLQAQAAEARSQAALKVSVKRGGTGTAAPAAKAATAREKLSQVLADEYAEKQEIKSQMDAVRKEERLKAEALRAARAKLRPLLTLEQEATLMVLGYMD